ncbi:MAG: permease [Campylobacterales bacterium]|nr:permease [Campylobacterales bacterium]
MKPKENPPFATALKKSALSFATTLPLLLGVILLVGMVQALVSREMIASLFGHGALIDTVIGTAVGAVASGNPSIGYMVGGELLGQGVSLFAITAFILAWVTLGVVGLPAEIGVFGIRFTLMRNLLSLVFTFLLSLATVATIGALS